MNSPIQEYLLLFRGDDWSKKLSAEELQAYMTKSKAWFDRLAEQGKIKGGQPLLTEGRLVSGKGGRVLSDGPFAESKEAIGGYVVLTVGSFDEAVAIARELPALDHGTTVEVRPIADECPHSARIRELSQQLAGAAA